MTRKEAIEIFKNMLDAWDNYYTIAQSDKKREAVWLAISSLETDEAYQLEYERTTKNDLAHERYQDLIEYFGDEKVAKTILESRKEFKAWLERLRWHVKRADELDRELEQIKGTTKNNLGVDCISRAQTQTEIEMNASRYTIAKERGGMGQVEWSDQLIKVSDAVDIIRNLPSVTPQEPKCKDCKWWKDSDGAYRRGIGAESKCPMNRIEVYEGNGYCFLFEPQESEDKE